MAKWIGRIFRVKSKTKERKKYLNWSSRENFTTNIKVKTNVTL